MRPILKDALVLGHDLPRSQILPDGEVLYADEVRWKDTLTSLGQLSPGDFESAASILLEPMIESQGVDAVVERWKLSNDEKKSIKWICRHWKTLIRAHEIRWSEVQPLLLTENAARTLAVIDARMNEPSEGVAFCRERLAWPTEKLDPQPLLDGADLIRLGVKQGPQFKSILEAVRNAQLDGEIETSAQAEQLALGND